jgi:hypothetical protein
MAGKEANGSLRNRRLSSFLGLAGRRINPNPGSAWRGFGDDQLIVDAGDSFDRANFAGGSLF